MGVIHPDAAENFGAPAGTVYFEIEVKCLISAAKMKKTYRQLPKYPAISRDLAFVVDKTVPVGDILRTTGSAAGSYLESVDLFDVFEDERLGASKKSVALTTVYRSSDKTLTDSDIRESIEKIIARLKKQYGAELRQ